MLYIYTLQILNVQTNNTCGCDLFRNMSTVSYTSHIIAHTQGTISHEDKETNFTFLNYTHACIHLLYMPMYIDYI